MTKVRILIMILVVLATAGGCYYFLADHTDGDASSAYKAWKSGDYYEAHKRLSKVWSDLPPTKRHLYRAYIHREEGLIPASDQQLERALQTLGKKRDHLLMWEIHLNRALNAHLAKKDCGEALDSVRAIVPNHPYTELLEGVMAFNAGDFDRASASFSEPALPTTDSDWLNRAVEIHFSTEWRKLQLARCLIEEGQFDRARGLLRECATREVGPLLVLSYFKEGEGQPLATALETYRRAGPFLDGPTDELLRAAKRFFSAGPELYAQAIIYFSQWTPSLAEDIAKRIAKDSQAALALDAALPDGPFRKQIGTTLETLTFDWELIRRFGGDPARLSARLHKQILDVVTYDIKQAKELLSIWQRLQGGNPTELAHELISIAHSLWVEPSKEEKGFELMVLASSILPPSEQPAFRNQVANVLRRIYNRAKRHNDVGRLSLIHQAARYFHLEALDPDAKTEVANQLADATYFLMMGNVQEAASRARWVTQLDPENQDAHRMLGLASYTQENYHAALMELGPLEDPDPRIQEVLGICHLMVGDKEEGQEILTALAKAQELSDRAYLLLGYEDAKWLEKIREKDSEVLVLLARHAHDAGSYREALDYLKNVEEPYASHEGVKSLAAFCYLKLGQPERAREALTKKGTVQSTAPLSNRFMQLFTQPLS